MDGGSTDDSVAIAEGMGAKVRSLPASLSPPFRIATSVAPVLYEPAYARQSCCDSTSYTLHTAYAVDVAIKVAVEIPIRSSSDRGAQVLKGATRHIVLNGLHIPGRACSNGVGLQPAFDTT